MRLGDATDGLRTAPVPFGLPAALVLDMDGTLLDTEGAYREAFEAAMARFGATVDGAFYAGLVGISSRERGAIVCARYGERFPWPEALADYRARKARLLETPVRAKPGAEALLAEIAARGLPCAVATSAGRRTAEAALGGAGLLGAIGALVTRDDVPLGKPHPAPFLRAAALLGADPARCVAVEDSPPGVAAARAAGMRVVLVPDGVPHAVPEDPGIILVADLIEVRAMLRPPRLRNGEAGGA